MSVLLHEAGVRSLIAHLNESLNLNINVFIRDYGSVAAGDIPGNYRYLYYTRDMHVVAVNYALSIDFSTTDEIPGLLINPGDVFMLQYIIEKDILLNYVESNDPDRGMEGGDREEQCVGFAFTSGDYLAIYPGEPEICGCVRIGTHLIEINGSDRIPVLDTTFSWLHYILSHTDMYAESYRLVYSVLNENGVLALE